MASPALMLVTRAGIWFRALSCMMKTPATWADTARIGTARSALLEPAVLTGLTVSPPSPARRDPATQGGSPAGPGCHPEGVLHYWHGQGADAACACRRNHDGGWAHSAAIARQVQPADLRSAT